MKKLKVDERRSRKVLGEHGREVAVEERLEPTRDLSGMIDSLGHYRAARDTPGRVEPCPSPTGPPSGRFCEDPSLGTSGFRGAAAAAPKAVIIRTGSQ